MSHRAQQIVEAIEAALNASTTLGAAVFVHRVASVSAEDGELPAVCINYGEDVPVGDSGVENTVYIDSLLTVTVDCFARDTNEPAVRTALLELRRQVHMSLQAAPQLGLSFVSDTQYAGAEAPSMVATSEFYAGSLTTTWRVRYRMNITDPA